jgi:hypothetical protein
MRHARSLKGASERRPELAACSGRRRFYGSGGLQATFCDIAAAVSTAVFG